MLLVNRPATLNFIRAGYVLYWQLTKMGAKCEVMAPTLVPVKAGNLPAGRPERHERSLRLTSCRELRDVLWPLPQRGALRGGGERGLGARDVLLSRVCPLRGA